MSRPAWAEIRLDALRHNYLLAKRASGAHALAVVKANAYGHGAIRCAEALIDLADGFAVAAIEEALALRQAGITAPILLLEGFFEPAELELIQRERLWTVVHHRWQVDAILEANLREPLTVWLKLDSGMHRVGLGPTEYAAAFQALRQSGKVARLVRMTHFARADEPEIGSTADQIERFRSVTEPLDAAASQANSAGILAWPASHGQWVRPGIMLYGASPFAEGANVPLAAELKPVMQLEARIHSVRELPAGEPIGYGGRFVTQRPTRVGVVACGYADGYPRAAGTGTPVLIDGQASQLIGRVSMDMLTVDLTDLPQSGLGSVVRLWGDGVPAERIADRAGTIPYELFCNIKRVAMRYTGL